MPERKVETRHLKAIALRELPPGSPLRETILATADRIDAQDFLSRLDIWVTLLEMEGKKK